jgi:hypothetical protein
MHNSAPMSRLFRSSRRSRRSVQWLALGLLCSFLAVSLRPALQTAFIHLRELHRHAHESSVEARARCLGPAFIGAIEAIRRELAPEEPYLLVEGGDPRDGGAVWVRYELAPRRALFLGPLDRLRGGRHTRARVAAGLRHVVVAYGPGRPPALLERYRFMAELDRRDGH